MFEGLRLSHWKVARGTDGVLMLTMDRSGSNVNALSRALLDELDAMLERVAIERPVAVVIHSGKPSGFAVGADLKEFEGYERQGAVREEIENGQRVFERLAQLPMPTVAAIHGACMGGGTELALACRMRVAARAPETRIALPEVQLGIHPGWGGTARAPRIIGLGNAVEMVTSGENVDGATAYQMGLASDVVASD
ncbi:MAG: enoyl-CoA hydratase/isomerase family protein, partial [Pseudomonadota bacterium]